MALYRFWPVDCVDLCNVGFCEVRYSYVGKKEAFVCLYIFITMYIRGWYYCSVHARVYELVFTITCKITTGGVIIKSSHESKMLQFSVDYIVLRNCIRLILCNKSWTF